MCTVDILYMRDRYNSNEQAIQQMGLRNLLISSITETEEESSV